MSEERFTVVIPTRNRLAIVLDLLGYLRQGLRWTGPIIVVDQSDDGGAELARRLREDGLTGVDHYPHLERGVSHARNAGALRARTEWLVFLDDDMRPARDYLSSAASFVQANPWVDAVQGLKEDRAGWDLYSADKAGWRTSRHRQALLERADMTGASGAWWFLIHRRAPYPTLSIGVSGSNLVVRKKAFLGAGGFDGQMHEWGEDMEFGVRLWWYGYRVCFCPELAAFHLHAPVGGNRGSRKGIVQRLFEPQPSPSWLYLHLQWLPGLPYRQLLTHYLLKSARRPWTFPVHLVRLLRAARIARQRAIAGPQYAQAPCPRCGWAAGSGGGSVPSGR